jgi:transcriptional regulator with XRE-family HTH domain
MHKDDERLAELIRAIRRELGQTQVQLAVSAGIPLNDVKRIEAGVAGSVRLARIRKAFEAVDGRLYLSPWWRGAAADRLLDERHAELVERLVALLRERGWIVEFEVSFNEWGERGSIDVLAWHPTRHAVAVCEVKTAFGSLEETNRILDVKVRVAPVLIERRVGWRPAVVGRILVVPGSSTIRRTIANHAATMGSKYPARSLEVRAWLREPSIDLSAIYFLSDRRHTTSVPD